MLYAPDTGVLWDSESAATALKNPLKPGPFSSIFLTKRLEARVGIELLRAFIKSMPLNSELFKLLSNTFKLDIPKEPATKGEPKKKKNEDSEKKEPFKPNRFPSFFRLRTESEVEGSVPEFRIHSYIH